MKLVPARVTRSVGRTILKSKKNSPHIFFGAGVVGVIGSTILACRATLKLEERLDEIRQDVSNVNTLHEDRKTTTINVYSEADHYRDLGYAYTKGSLRLTRLYGPAILIGGASIAALTGSHIQLTRRNAALTATLVAVSRAYEEYRERVREVVGEKQELELYQGIQEKEITIDGKKEKIQVLRDPSKTSVYARFFDEYNPNWVKNPEYNRIFVQCQENYANHLLHARGHVFLNDVYDSLGLDRSQAGAIVGWVLNGETSDNYISFGMYDVGNHPFVNGFERSVLLDFNVDGVIFDKIGQEY